MSYRRRAAVLASAVVTTVACGSSTAQTPKRHVDQVIATGPGACVVVYADDCPEGEPCPAETYGKEAIECPRSLANGKGAMRLYHNPTGCHVMHDVTCPKDATCNPPPPEDIPCPERYEPEPPPPPPEPVVEPRRIVRRPDGTCYEHFHIDCPKGFSCNPPPPRKVPCPPEEEKKAPSE